MAAILLVVGNAAAPTTADTYLESILEGLGHTVTLRSDDDADDVTGFNGVVIAESVASATIAAKYGTAAVPVITHETGNINDLGFSDVEGSTNVDTTDIDVQEPTHPIMDGPHGSFSATTWTVFSPTGRLGFVIDATLPAGVVSVATDFELSTRHVCLACEEGDDLTSGPAPGKRAFIWPTDLASPTINANGENMLKNAYEWAFGGPIGYRRLVGPRHLGASAETLYAVPSGRRTRMRNILVNNPTGSPVAATLSVGPDAASTRLLDAEPIAAGGAYRTRRKADYTLEAGEVIQGFASSGSALVIIIDGVEYAVA